MTSAKRVEVDSRKTRGGIEVEFSGPPSREIDQHLRQFFGLQFSNRHRHYWCRGSFAWDAINDYLEDIVDDDITVPGREPKPGPKAKAKAKAKAKPEPVYTYRHYAVEPYSLAVVRTVSGVGKESKTTSPKTQVFEQVHNGSVIRRILLGRDELDIVRESLASAD